MYLNELRKRFVAWQESLAERIPWVFMVVVTTLWALSVILFAVIFGQNFQWPKLIIIALLLGVGVSMLARRNLKQQGRWGNKRKKFRR